MLDELLSLLNTVGQVADTPWAMVRTGIAKRDPMAGLQAAYNWDSRSSGRDLLESFGMPENQPGLDWGDVAGFATEVIPDMLLPGAGLYKAAKWLRPAAEAGPSTRAVLDAIDTAVPNHIPPQYGDETILKWLEPEPPYYSRLQRAVEALPGEQFKSQSVLNQLRRAAPEGFSNEELQWSKLNDLLGNSPMVSKQQLLSHMDEALPTYMPEWERIAAKDAKYSEYSTGTGDYAEHLAKLPGEGVYDSPHFRGHDNPLLHIRTEAVDGPGGKSLLANELQSDWHQAGKKYGYAAPHAPMSAESRDMANKAYAALHSGDASQLPSGELTSRLLANEITPEEYAAAIVDGLPIDYSRRVPHAPFKDDWPLLGLKELLRQGVEQGADSVEWLPGKAVQGMVGGQLGGQQQFYDSDLVNIANKYIKNRGWDTSVGRGQSTIIQPGVGTPDIPTSTFRIPITDMMRSDILHRGQPLMSILPLLAMLNAFDREQQ